MSMLKTIGTVFIGIGMAGVAISAVSKIVKISQEKKNKAETSAVSEPIVSAQIEKVAIARPKPAQIRHMNELLRRVEIHDDRLKRSAAKPLSTIRKRTRVIIHK